MSASPAPAAIHGWTIKAALPAYPLHIHNCMSAKSGPLRVLKYRWLQVLYLDRQERKDKYKGFARWNQNKRNVNGVSYFATVSDIVDAMMVVGESCFLCFRSFWVQNANRHSDGMMQPEFMSGLALHLLHITDEYLKH